MAGDCGGLPFPFGSSNRGVKVCGNNELYLFGPKVALIPCPTVGVEDGGVHLSTLDALFGCKTIGVSAVKFYALLDGQGLARRLNALVACRRCCT